MEQTNDDANISQPSVGKSPLPSVPAPTVAELTLSCEGWLLDSEIRQLSAATLENRRLFVKNLLWFFEHKKITCMDTLAVRQFLAYITNGHLEEGGRWGNPQQNKPVRPRTVKDYYSNLRTLLRWMVDEGEIAQSPLEVVKAPISRADHVQPFTQDQIRALYAAAAKSDHPKRDLVIVMMLYDTGLRASELCALRYGDVDMQARKCTVLGKGNKRRPVPFGVQTSEALHAYILEQEDEWEHDENTGKIKSKSPLFRSDRGARSGESFTRSGLLHLIWRLGKAAGIESMRCSPHTFRHTFAVEFLRNGGNQFALMYLLGHTNIQMTARYVALAQADVAKQHRLYSPADRIGDE